MREWNIGDTGYLKEPYLGYRHFEVVDFEMGQERLLLSFQAVNKSPFVKMS